MPEVKTKAKPETKVKTDERPILHPFPRYEIHLGDGGTFPDGSTYLPAMTAQDFWVLMRCETEEEFKGRQVQKLLKDYPDTTPEDAEKFRERTTFSEYTLKDYDGRKCRSWLNIANREFREDHAYEIAQTLLDKAWRFNMEVTLVGKYGSCLSLQHRGWGLILAEQMWNSVDESHPWKKNWPDGPPTMDITIGYGAEEDEDTVSTIDNVLPRSLADVIFTSPYLRFKVNGKPVTSRERGTMARMAAKAVDVLWKRTGAAGSTEAYQTHAVSMDFLNRHKKILQSVKHVWEEAEGKGHGQKLAKIGLSLGQISALCYLMGCSGSDLDTYAKTRPPSDKKLDFKFQDKAEKFWTLIGDDNPEVVAVRETVADVERQHQRKAYREEKETIIARAWKLFAAGEPITVGALLIKPSEYVEGKNGVLRLKEIPGMGGIDIGEKIIKDVGDPGELDPDPDATEETRAEGDRKKRAAEIANKIKVGRENGKYKPGKGKPATEAETASK